MNEGRQSFSEQEFAKVRAVVRHGAPGFVRPVVPDDYEHPFVKCAVETSSTYRIIPAFRPAAFCRPKRFLFSATCSSLTGVFRVSLERLAIHFTRLAARCVLSLAFPREGSRVRSSRRVECD